MPNAGSSQRTPRWCARRVRRRDEVEHVGVVRRASGSRARSRAGCRSSGGSPPTARRRPTAGRWASRPQIDGDVEDAPRHRSDNLHFLERRSLIVQAANRCPRRMLDARLPWVMPVSRPRAANGSGIHARTNAPALVGERPPRRRATRRRSSGLSEVMSKTTVVYVPGKPTTRWSCPGGGGLSSSAKRMRRTVTPRWRSSAQTWSNFAAAGR